MNTVVNYLRTTEDRLTGLVSQKLFKSQSLRFFSFLVIFNSCYSLCVLPLQLRVSLSTGRGGRCVWSIPGTWRAWRMRRYSNRFKNTMCALSLNTLNISYHFSLSCHVKINDLVFLRLYFTTPVSDWSGVCHHSPGSMMMTVVLFPDVCHLSMTCELKKGNPRGQPCIHALTLWRAVMGLSWVLKGTCWIRWQSGVATQTVTVSCSYAVFSSSLCLSCNRLLPEGASPGGKFSIYI